MCALFKINFYISILYKMINDKLLINLRILGKIQKNGRISRSSDGIISLENETFYQPIKRFVTSDSRKQSVSEINSIITEAISTIDNILNSKYMKMPINYNLNEEDNYYKNYEDLSVILKELDNARNGIVNLQFTYNYDANASTQLDIIILKIDSTLKDNLFKLNYFKTFLSPARLQTEQDKIINMTQMTTGTNGHHDDIE